MGKDAGRPLVLICSATIFLLTQTAFAIGPASEDDARIIQSLIDRGNRIDENDVKTAENEAEKTANNKNASFSEKVRAATAVAVAKDRRDREWEAAAYLAIRAFDISNLPLTGVGTWPPFDNVAMQWKLEIGYAEARSVEAPSGEVITYSPSQNATATTYPDGVTRIYPQIFAADNAVDQLGFLLVHERAHYKQFTGLPSTITRAQAEYVALTAQLASIDAFDIPNREDTKEKLQWLAGECRKKMDGKPIDPRAEAILRLNDPVPAGFHSPEELIAIRQRQAEIAWHAEASARLMREYDREITAAWASGDLRSAAGEVRRLERRRDAELNQLAEGEEKDRTNRRLDDWAARCGMTRAKSGSLEFRNHDYELRFRVSTEEQARAAFLLEGACLYPDEESPCIDAMSELDDGWSDGEFRDSMLLAVGSSGLPSDCVYAVLDHYRPGRGYRGLRDVVADFHRDSEARARRSITPSPSRPRDVAQPARPTPQPKQPAPDSGRFWDPVIGGWVAPVKRQ
ncbi:MAG: hypothetical protein HY925_11810 [Elusimicrobia bacterium]|nr:hypothetical protein [Elusimicrobiota bacterium]